jgi:MoxR-like ATPase
MKITYKKTTRHTALVYTVAVGEARIAYAHPAITATSFSFVNKSLFPERGKLLEVRINLMASGKRIIRGTNDVVGITSVDQWLSTDMKELLKNQAEALNVSSDKTFIIPTAFDGGDDKNYYKHTGYVPRFGEKVAQEVVPEVSSNEEDDFEKYGELYVPKVIIRALSAIKKLAHKGASNLLLVGPSGNGKTSLAKQFADMHDLSFTKINCSVIRDPEEWFGIREAKDGSTIFVESDFTKAVKHGKSVILLDEINRLEPYIHNSLMPLLDETRSTKVHGHEITCGPEVIFISTMNMGAGFVGTFILDTAIRNRMDATIVMPSLTAKREIALLVERTGIEEADAQRIVSNLDKLRDVAQKNQMDIDISHRTALKIARTLATGDLLVKEAFALVIFNNAESSEQAKMLVDSLLGSL